MIRYNLYLTENQDKKLKRLHGSRAVIVRRAIDEYLDKLEREKYKATTSPSVKKGTI